MAPHWRRQKTRRREHPACLVLILELLGQERDAVEE